MKLREPLSAQNTLNLNLDNVSDPIALTKDPNEHTKYQSASQGQALSTIENLDVLSILK